MPARLGFLHTAESHVETFGRLLDQLGPAVAARHLVAEPLLVQARAAGGITEPVAAAVAGALRELAGAGATVILCTCSTLGAAAEQLAPDGVRALRVDRPMAARAVALGERIALVATLASTLAPTRALIEEEAARAGRPVAIEERLVEGAWERFAAGDRAGYLALIAEALTQLPPCDAVVLAQASMADAAAGVMLEAPVLSSPRLGLEAALAALGEPQ
jgi:hypothetical protein